MPERSAQLIHDELLATKPPTVVHEPCHLCAGDIAHVKEVAHVTDANSRTYTEAEHVALLTDAVRRETAELQATNEGLSTFKAELTSRVDVLEAEKSAAEAARDAATEALESFKAEVARTQEIEKAKQDRLDKVKAAAEHLPDSYFNDERIQRWAEMTEEAFTAFIEDITGAAPAAAVKETAAFKGGDSGTGKKAKASLGSMYRVRREAAATKS